MDWKEWINNYTGINLKPRPFTKDIGLIGNAIRNRVAALGMVGRPANERIFIDRIARGNTKPITEQDFTPAELQEMRKLPLYNNRIAYRSYKPGSGLKEVFGNAGMQVQNKQRHITDQYDFGPYGMFGGKTIIPSFGSGGMARYIAERVYPENKGLPVDVNLGN